ncbi:membrane bound O-acyl transferase family-domain-containing protein [Melanogaster broomeanus]|nr:membrane bound O-acyl transferase family-domain-containing protein [Melanogaster broomeanus]
MSFAALCLREVLLRDVLRVPPTPVSMNLANFLSHLLPPVLSYFGAAVLVVMPRTKCLRVVLWPLVALLASRAALSFDFSIANPEGQSRNMHLMIFIMTRTLDWTLATEPLQRYIRPENSAPSVSMDALDLALNFRGCGWNWSKGLRVPQETRPLARTRFVGYAILSAGLHGLICSILHTAVKAFSPNTFGSIQGGTIFDETLPFFARYLRSAIITTIFTSTTYCSLQVIYNLCIIPAVLILRQDPAQWPPAFDAPWMATSVNDFWARRWHQLFRRTFLFLAGDPLSRMFGSTGRIIGGFLASGVFHDIMAVTLNGQMEPWNMIQAFTLMGIGAVCERMFLRWSGRRVEGLTGWVWTMTWVILCSSLMVDGWARGGVIGSSSMIDRVGPLRAFVEHSVMAFDVWLRAF